MVLPFEVACSQSELCICLLALKSAAGARNVYECLDLRQLIVSFLSTHRFDNLADAVSAALRARSPTVWVLRNVTLPAPAPTLHFDITTDNTATYCFAYCWAMIPAGASVMLISKGGPWRIRHECPGTSDDIHCDAHSLFVLGMSAALSIRSICFEPYQKYSDSKVYLATIMADATQQDGVVELADDVRVSAEDYSEIVHKQYSGAQESPH